MVIYTLQNMYNAMPHFVLGSAKFTFYGDCSRAICGVPSVLHHRRVHLRPPNEQPYRTILRYSRHLMLVTIMACIDKVKPVVRKIEAWPPQPRMPANKLGFHDETVGLSLSISIATSCQASGYKYVSQLQTYSPLQNVYSVTLSTSLKA